MLRAAVGKAVGTPDGAASLGTPVGTLVGAHDGLLLGPAVVGAPLGA